MNIYEKFGEIRHEIGIVQKDANNPFTNTTYSSASNVLKIINPIFYKYKTAFIMDARLQCDQLATYTQTVYNELNYDYNLPANASMKERDRDNDRIKSKTITTTVPTYNIPVSLVNIEDPKDRIDWLFVVPSDISQTNPIQGFGSTSTYSQRYVLSIIFGIALEDNEDPDKNMDKIDESFKRPEQKSNNNRPITEPQIKRLFAIAARANNNQTNIAKVVNTFGYHKVEEVAMKDYEEICNILSKPYGGADATK